MVNELIKKKFIYFCRINNNRRTHLDTENRYPWIEIKKKKKYMCLCIFATKFTRKYK